MTNNKVRMVNGRLVYKKPRTRECEGCTKHQPNVKLEQCGRTGNVYYLYLCEDCRKVKKW